MSVRLSRFSAMVMIAALSDLGQKRRERDVTDEELAALGEGRLTEAEVKAMLPRLIPEDWGALGDLFPERYTELRKLQASMRSDQRSS